MVRAGAGGYPKLPTNNSTANDNVVVGRFGVSDTPRGVSAQDALAKAA